MLAISDPVLLAIVGAFVTIFTSISAILTPWILSRIIKVTNTKLERIHTLVNSEKTTAMMAELASVRREHVMMEELIGLRRKAGNEPGPGTIKILDMTVARITELEAAIADRLSQTALAEDQMRKDQAAIVGIRHG